jgi:hypothetical protein
MLRMLGLATTVGYYLGVFGMSGHLDRAGGETERCVTVPGDSHRASHLLMGSK